MSGAQDPGSPATVTGNDTNTIKIKFVHQPSDRGLSGNRIAVPQNPGATLEPHLVVRLEGVVDPMKLYTATATVTQYMDASDVYPQPKPLDPHVTSTPAPGRVRDNEDGAIEFEWSQLTADMPGWYYVSVTLLEEGHRLVTICNSNKFLAKRF